MHSADVLIPIVGMMIPIIIVPTIMILKYLGKRGEWEHEQRLKAIERGHPPTPSLFWPSMTAIAIGAGVPVGCFFFAWMASVTRATDENVFIAATLISLCAVVAGGVLGLRACAMTGRHTDVRPTLPGGKPESFDPDSLDIVSRRG